MIENVKFKSLVDQIYDQLSKLITEGEIKPGEKLIESDLCSKFGVSRSPIRECLRILESEEIIVVNPRKGAYVSELTHKDIENIIPVRISLESLAGKLAIPNIGDREIQIFNELILRMEEAIRQKDFRFFVDLNFKFHGVFIQAANNKVLEKTLNNLARGLWQRIVFKYAEFLSESELEFSNRMHKEIAKEFQKKDSYSVQRLIEEHIEHGKRVFMKSFELKSDSGSE
jgi:DNA-binding GntR family transcriptional regulator